jgi:ABC-type Na+ efflux pump permease subunit
LRNIWLVIKHEVVTTLKRASFWIMTFLMRALLLGLQIYSAIQDSDLDLKNADADKTEETSTADMPVIGLVDEAEIITEMPVDFPPRPVPALYR